MNLQSFDFLLTNRIGYGIYQTRTFAIISLIDFLDGAELMFLSLLNTILYKEWNLSLNELIIIGTVFNFGLFIGAIICSIYADKLGRRNILILGSVI